MRISLLDYGYLELVESWGSDERVVEAARMSTQKGFEGWGPLCGDCGAVKTERGGLCDNGCGRVERDGDEKLLGYLWKNSHATPFEFAGLVVEVKCPLFVRSEWHRHRTWAYNEMSSRYAPLPDENYIPSVERLMVNAGGGNKQAGTVAGAAALSVVEAEWFRKELARVYAHDEELYQQALKWGVPKELARVHLPVGRYTRFRGAVNLRNALAFLTLRQAKNAQYEIRQYADAMHGVLAELFPRTLALFDAGRGGA